MATKKPGPKSTPKAKEKQDAPVAPVMPIFPFTFNVKLIILAVLSFILYADTLGNEYALDDGIVIIKNTYVQKGFDGIGKIMTTDAYDSYYKEMSAGQQLSGGRYRPLSEVIFAIEHAIFGESSTNNITTIRHFCSVLCFVLCVLAIFYFLSQYLLKKVKYGEDMAFFTTLLFAIHPIHTEVVANVKSLDEILSILCICLTFIFSLKYLDSKKISDLIIGGISFFLALLAKEYAVTLVMLIPMLFYLLKSKSKNKSAEGLPYFPVFVLYSLVFIIYVALRGKAVGFNGHVATNEILDNPYLLATSNQKLGTELFVLGKYLWLLIVPYPLISDYSYAQIPYQNLFSLPVIFVVLLYIAITVWGFRLLRKKNVLAFAVFFYLFNLALVSNLFMDIGATMGERLIFHSSLGFLILVSYGVFELIQKMNIERKRVVLYAASSILIVVFGGETMARNLKWKNDLSLFTNDVKIGENSIMLNGNAGARFDDLGAQCKDSAHKVDTLKIAIKYLRKSIFLHKRSPYISSYLNLGVAYYELHKPDSAQIYWDVVKRNYPDYPNLQRYFYLLGNLYLTKGVALGAQHNYAAASREIYKGIYISPADPQLWYNLGGVYYTSGKYDSAHYAWIKTLQLDPNNGQAKNGLATLVSIKKK